jgi:photosystem II stability/assembly factor-like uncharacterized protein
MTVAAWDLPARAQAGDRRPPPPSEIEKPGYTVVDGMGEYTGFNSVDLQSIYAVTKHRAARSQIARGWGKPIVVRLPDGRLLASQYKNLQSARNPKYPSAVEEAALSESRDEGRTWTQPRLLGIPGRVTQLTALRDGSLVMCTDHAVFRSEDGGASWKPAAVEWHAPDGEASRGRLVFGETNGVTEMPDGTLICGAYLELAPGKSSSYVLRSKDGGRRWGDASFVASASEVSYAALPSGRLIGFARVANANAGEGGASLAQVESADGGRTWTAPKGIGLGQAQVPGFPLYLSDGRLLLLYGNRQFPFGSQVIGSRDQGATWDVEHPILLSWFSWDNYCGHPRSIVGPDGTIITGYYTRMFKGDDVNHDIVSHVVIWRVPPDWPATR